MTTVTFPSTLYETYIYDAVGNLTSKTDRKSHAIGYTYDQLNRLTQKSYPDSTAVNYTYDNDSRQTQASDPTGTYQFTFDNMGRLTGTTTSYAFLTGRNFTTSYSYDKASNRTGFTDPESGATAYVYDTLNRLQTLTPPSAFSSTGFGFSYDALSRRTQLTRPNSVTTTYSYDNLSRLLSVTHALSGTTLDGASYTVDNAGNRSSRTPLPGTTATNYTYDAIYELLTAKVGSTTNESYTYDAVGNRLSSLGVSPYTVNSSNELTSTPSTTYTYDYNGNTLTKVVGTNTTSYAWDYENRLTSVTLPGTGGTVTVKYDPFGRRIYKSSSSGTSIFAYDGDNLVEETNSSGTVVARYSEGPNLDEPLALLRGGTTDYYLADGLGSATSLTNSAATAVQTYTYDSFGNIVATTGSLTNSRGYTGREFDTETSLYYYRARYYDPTAGRFISEDPIRFGGGDVNLYRVVRNRPRSFTDPLGLVVVDPNFDPGCLPSLKRALDIVRKIAKNDALCNCAFRRLASHRSLRELVEDPNITIHYAPPPDKYTREADGQWTVQTGFTPAYDTHNFYIRPFTCRMGRWDLATTIVHELTHIGTGSVPGDEAERTAQEMEQKCGLGRH